MDDSDPFATYRQPTANRPLLGLTILIIEDSRYASEAMRLLCLRSGARIRRADCLKSARRHLQIYRPSILIVDLGLPDGSGAELISEMASASPRIGMILGMSGDDLAKETALSAGADGFLEKPVSSLAVFQTEIMSKLPDDQQLGPRILTDEVIRPDPIAYQDDMAHAAEVMNEAGDAAVLDYLAQFIGGVARSAQDHVLANAAADLSQARKDGRPVTQNAARMAGLVQERLQQRKAI
ncbi:MAG: response regulator [Pseudomonadota bacterium]